MAKPDSKPARSQWIYFRNAKGVGDWRKMVVVWKAERGHVDLQFSGMSSAELFSRASAFLSDEMTIVPAGKSASIRLRCSKVDFGCAPEEQVEAIRSGLELADYLRRFAIANEAILT